MAYSSCSKVRSYFWDIAASGERKEEKREGKKVVCILVGFAFTLLYSHNVTYHAMGDRHERVPASIHPL